MTRIFNLVGQVEARRVTHETASEVAAWCSGVATWGKLYAPGEEIVTPQSFSGITCYANQREMEAAPGEWIIKTGSGHFIVFTDPAFRDSVIEDPDTGFERWRIEQGRAYARDFMARLARWREQVDGGALVVSGAGLIHHPECASISSLVDADQRWAQMVLDGDQQAADELGELSLPDLVTESRADELTRSGKRWCKTCATLVGDEQ